MNPVLLRQFGDRAYLAGELVKIFKPIKTFGEDKYASLHLHNDLWQKIRSVIGDNDIELRLRIAQIIFELGSTESGKEIKEESNRRAVKS